MTIQTDDEWKLLYYQERDGRMPFREWQASLVDRIAEAAIRSRLERMRVGLFGDCKAVGEGVSEFRVDTGSGYRGYFFRAGRRLILLLCGGDKGTQDADIERAKKYRRDYEKRIRAAVGPR